jgi:hypothetical protein
MAQCLAEERDFRGWSAAYLKNDLITLVAVPDIGGRIMAYDLGPYSYFYLARELAGKVFTTEENQGDGSLAAWKNYGGDKTWPAPQGWDNDKQWHGPPDSVLDTGRYRLDALYSDDASASLRMVSPDTSPTGVEITRHVTIHAGSTRVTLDLSFRNVSNRTVRWSIWDVAQLRAERVDADGQLAPEIGCLLTAPLNPNSRFPNGFQVMFGNPANPQWCADRATGLFYGGYKWEIGKVGLDSRAGWAAFANSTAGFVFTARFPVFPDGEYPDNGSTVEFWTVGRGRVANLNYEGSQIYLMECEVLSPFQHIAPGKVASFRIEWGAARCPGWIVDVSQGGCTSRKLSIGRDGDYARVSGTFGVFDVGELELTWQAEEGSALGTISLGPVGPLGSVILDQVVHVPSKASEAQLNVKAGSLARELASARVTNTGA